jgi:glutamate synthase (NADPH/NADH) large chain
MANPDTIVWRRVVTPHWAEVLETLVREHRERTGSAMAIDLLKAWPAALEHFWIVAPKELLSRLPHPLEEAAAVAAE